MIEVALSSYLTSFPAIASRAADRVYPITLPQNPTLPAITYERLDRASVQSHDGSSGLAHPTFRVNVWAKSHFAAVDLAENVRLSLQGFKGLMAGKPVQAVLMSPGGTSVFEDETKIWREILEFTIWHAEEAPQWQQ